MAFASVDAIVTALAGTAGQRLQYQKLAQSTTATNIPSSLWTATGIPAEGSSTASGVGNAAVCTSATTGAMPFANATGPATMHLVNGEVLFTANATGVLWIVDRIAHCQVAHNQATASFSPILDATSRLATGEGAQIWCEVTSAFSGASNTITFDYTDQDGNAGTSAVVTTASAIVRRSVNSNLYQPLAAGDKGVRTITGLTLTAGTATGAYNVCLVKPICSLPIPAVVSPVARDFVIEMPQLPRIRDDACLMGICIFAGTVTPRFFTELQIVEG